MAEKKALVIGLGASGLATARFLHSHGWKVKVVDTRANPPALAKMRSAMPEAEFIGGSLSPDLLGDEQLVVISPGLSPFFSEAAPLVKKAKEKGIDVVSEIELFARYLRQLRLTLKYEPKIIGITGTNGKTTTTTLTAAIVEESGMTVCCAGNVGSPALSELMTFKTAETLPEVWVLELSSFQLETTANLVCDAATLLNLTEDHINWHGSMEEYGACKKKIFSNKTIRVLNRDDEFSIGCAKGVPPELVRTFGESAPSKPGEYGLEKDGAFSWLAFWPEGADKTVKLIPDNALKIRGTHNKMNALAASALAIAIGVDVEVVRKALRSYEGLPHRVQTVLTCNDIEYIDDSKGSNVGATVAALKGFTDKKVVIILGGDGKGQDFSDLVEPVEEHCRGVGFIGKDGPKIEEELKSVDLPKEHATDMLDAVKKCRKMAKEGDAILLSPACASWDMYKDYAERSADFLAAAKEVAREEGCPC